MNERIKELALQAGYKHPNAVGMCEDYAYFSLENFAELIVQECADIVANSYLPDAYSEECLPEIADDIKKHFGVEE